MIKTVYTIELQPSGKLLVANEGDNLLTLLMVAGMLSADDDNDKVKLEKGSVSPSVEAQKEAAIFSKSEIAEGWMLASLRRVSGNAVIYLPTATEKVDRHQSIRPITSGYGLSVDIGAGTIAAGLIELATMQIPILDSTINSQMTIAADLTSRMALCRNNPQQQCQLSKMLWDDIETLTRKLTNKAGININEIKIVSLVANRYLEDMLYTACCYDYNDTKKTRNWLAKQLPCSFFNDDCQIILLPEISDDIGSDTTAAILAAGLLDKRDNEQVTLLVDFGMSSEVVAAGGGKIVAASIASPPFEGGHIDCGMRVGTGAITQVTIEDDLILQTYADAIPKGISGAGLVSLIAAMLNNNMLNNSGRLVIPENISPQLKERFRYSINGMEFVLSINKFKEIYINQNDIRQMQLAKGNIYAACQSVLAAIGASTEDIEQILIAETTGANISAKASLIAGFLPEVEDKKIISIGNAAWQGAYLVLGNKLLESKLQEIVTTVERLDLTSDTVFAEQFITAMNFSV